MKKTILILAAVAATGMAPAGIAQAQASDHFIVHQLDQPPAEAAAMVRAFVETDDNWSFIAEFPTMGGAVVGMKICYNPIRGDVVAAGLHNLALMPCGNLAFYEEDGQSTLSMLDMRYMSTLSPGAEIEAAVEKSGPAYAAMLTEVLAVD
jgi:hypothetical protein